MRFKEDNRGVFHYSGGTFRWEIRVRDFAGKTETVSPAQMKNFRREQTAGSFCWTAENGLEIRLMQAENAEFSFSFSKCPKEWEIREIHFPVFDIEEAEARILLPESIGYLAGAAKELPDGLNYRRSFYPFQMTAIMNEDSGMLALLPDSKHYCKNILLTKTDGQVKLSAVFFVPLKRRRNVSFAMPFPVIIREFSGDWFEAARIYRNWAEKQRFYLRTRRQKNPLREIAMWFWNRGSAENVSAPVLEFARRCKLPLALDWYWWHHNPYDTDYPFYWPPREGVKTFRRHLLATLALLVVYKEWHRLGGKENYVPPIIA